MNLIERAKKIVLTPKAEWEVIAPEITTTAELYRGYIIPLSAIGPIAQFIGLSLIGVSLGFFGSFRVPVVWALTQSIVSYVLGLVGIYIISLIVDALAPSFSATKNPMQALKVAAYAFTPFWIASVLHIVPPLSLLVLLAGFYSLYVLFLGLPVLMKAPADKALGYTAVIVVCSFVVMACIGLVAGAVGGMGMGAGRLADMGGATLAGRAAGTQAGRDQLNAMSAQIQVAADQMQAAQKAGDAQAQVAAAGNALAAVASGGVAVDPVDQSLLKGMLPETAAGLPRTGSEATKGGAGALQVSKAEATYSNGQGTDVHLSITDFGAAKMFGAFAAWALIEQDKESDTGYEKMGKVGGRPVHEVFNKNGPQTEYTTVVAERFLVEAHGSRVDMDTLKQAVTGLDLAKLESMKNDGVKKAN